MSNDLGEWMDRGLTRCLKLPEANVLHDNLAEISDRIKERSDADSRPTVVDFSNIGYLNSSAFATLLVIRKYVVLEKERELALTGVPIDVYGAFVVMGINRLFHMYESVEKAEESLVDSKFTNKGRIGCDEHGEFREG